MRSLFALHLLPTALHPQAPAPGTSPRPVPEPELAPMDPAAWRAWAAAVPESAAPPAPVPTTSVRRMHSPAKSGS